MSRIVQPELLDTLPPEDLRAVHSRRDLQRLNRIMGHRAKIIRVLKNQLCQPPKQITELGAGDGNLLLRLAQKTSVRWTDVNVTLLDRQKSVHPDTLAAFWKLGWGAETVVADVFDPALSVNLAQVVIANLFLHHFEDARLAELLGTVARHAKLFVALEPHRFARPERLPPWLKLIGCNEVTCHDAVASIRAGFDGQEISALWPDRKNWRLSERRAGLFSHMFIARRED